MPTLKIIRFMKINKYQRIIVLLYCIAFIYLSLIHVPFKINRGNDITYDTLFSERANLESGRLALVIIITTIISVALFLLAHNLQFNFKLKKIAKPKSSFYILLGIIIISLSAFF